MERVYYGTNYSKCTNGRHPKKDFDSVCNDLGLSMTTAITMLAKKMAREKRLPFEVSVDPFYSDENMARLKKSIAQMEATGGTVHEVNTND